MTTKTDKIVDYMRKHKGITQLDAYDVCKATRLGAIIFELKHRHGFEITTDYFKNEGAGRYAMYSLTPKFKKYLTYVDRWKKEHKGKEFDSMQPACYAEWKDNEENA